MRMREGNRPQNHVCACKAKLFLVRNAVQDLATPVNTRIMTSVTPQETTGTLLNRMIQASACIHHNGMWLTQVRWNAIAKQRMKQRREAGGGRWQRARPPRLSRAECARGVCGARAHHMLRECKVMTGRGTQAVAHRFTSTCS